MSLSAGQLFLVYLAACCAGLAAAGVDPDTRETTLRRYTDGKTLQIVMSDEFSLPGRSFEKGRDPNFEAIEKPDNSNQALEFCKSLLQTQLLSLTLLF